MGDPNEHAATFGLIDTDGDGRISVAELGAWLVGALGDGVGEDSAEQAVRAIDGDGDGYVSLEEFSRLLSDNPPTAG